MIVFLVFASFVCTTVCWRGNQARKKGATSRSMHNNNGAGALGCAILPLTMIRTMPTTRITRTLKSRMCT